jgi:ribosomal protein L29
MKEFRGKTSKELVKMLIEKRNALQAFRLGNAGSKTKNVKEGRSLRKDIARIMTELNVVSKTEVKEPKEKVVEAKPKKVKAKAK